MDGDKRIEYIDLMKGFCIILVVMHHSEFISDVEHGNRFMHALLVGRMPLYFFLSGLFFKDYGSFRRFFARKFRNLIVPILVFAPLGGFLMQAVPWREWSWGVVTAPAQWLAYMTTFTNVPLWFLRALFLSLLMVYGLHRLTVAMNGRTWAATAVALSLSIGIYGFAHHLPELSELQRKIVLRSGLFHAAEGLIFVWSGYLARRAGLLSLRHDSKGYGVAAIAGVACAGICALMPLGSISWYLMDMGVTYPALIINAFSTTAFVWALSFVLQRLPYVSYMGRYSIVVLCTHYPLLRILNNAFHPEPAVTLCIILALMPAIIYACVRWLPWACAQPPRPRTAQTPEA